MKARISVETFRRNVSALRPLGDRQAYAAISQPLDRTWNKRRGRRSRGTSLPVVVIVRTPLAFERAPTVDTMKYRPYTGPKCTVMDPEDKGMLDLNRLRGIFPPILTPQQDDESVDHASLGRLVSYLLDQGVHG